MNGFGNQTPSTPNKENTLEQEPWTVAEMDLAKKVYTASKSLDSNAVPNLRTRYLRAAQNEGYRNIKKFTDFTKGVQSALMFLSNSESIDQGIKPPTDDEYFAELAVSDSLRHGLHPEDEVDLINRFKE